MSLLPPRRAALAATKTAAASEVKLLPPIAPVVPDQAYPETAARPIFTPTRRPAPAAPTPETLMMPAILMPLKYAPAWVPVV